MEEKTAYEAFFDNTQDIQCITCLDAYVFEYYICDCRVRVERISKDKFFISIKGYDSKNKKDHYKKEFSKEWKENNIYNQAIYKKYVSGYFFH